MPSSLLVLLSLFSFGLSQTITDFQLNDLFTLNYALSLEHLENAFYRQGLTRFNEAAFAAAGYNSTVRAYFTLIALHEQTHVDSLTAAIRARGQTNPVSECVYDFGYGNNVNQFVSIAATLENTGVMAYDGAINTLTELALQTVAASVATVEGRHAAYLNLLTGQVPYTRDDAGLDTALPPLNISQLVAATGFVRNCSNSSSIPLPIPASFPANVPSNVTATNQNDYNAVQFALRLEDLENAFYIYGFSQSNAADFAAQGYNSTVYEYLRIIGRHETAHAAFLRSVFVSPVLPCVYNFTFGNNVPAFLELARVFENTGTSAYVGAVNAIKDLGYRQAAATIATIEARHASYLNLLTQRVPFPNVTEPVLLPADVIRMVTPFIIDCPGQVLPDLPVPSSFSPAAVAPAFNGRIVVTTASTTAQPLTSSFITPSTTSDDDSSTTGLVSSFLVILMAMLLSQ